MKAFQPATRCPLDGVRVLDLSRVVAGNMVSLLLADFGAEVVKIEPPAGDPLRDWLVAGVPTNWKVYARNKKSVCLDLRKDEAKTLLLQLVDTAQVFIENFRPGTLEKMGLGPDVLHARNPKLVIVRVTGWGQTGPYRHKPGFGTLAEGASGFAALNGFADREPVLPPIQLADCTAGVHGAFATLVAVREVEVRGGRGQVIDLSLLEPLFSFMGPQAASFQASGRLRPRTGSRSTTAAPRNAYRTSDDRWVCLSASTQAMTERLFRVIGRAELIDNPRYRTNAERVQHAAELDAIIGDFIGRMTLAQNLEFFDRADVTVGPIYDIAQIIDDPHVKAREMVSAYPDEEMGTVPMHCVVPRLSVTPGAIRRPAPGLGEHNAEILGALGLGADELARLSAAGIICAGRQRARKRAAQAG
ncbi:MAG: acyl-CoA transferase [Betaproteobacteria bacterium SG8_41]|jgi:crotonobetainyl-CoA:carnitine CoA-transferase CaiB-like acyl-CoA transferase|nr:MAG: acyl-CoA transferase [Betaproteobacteria bacterium SG8_41]